MTKLKAFKCLLGKDSIHLKIYCHNTSFYMCTMCIRNFSSNQNIYHQAARFDDGSSYSVKIAPEQEEVKIVVESTGSIYDPNNLQSSFAVSTVLGTELFYKTLDGERNVSIVGEEFQKMKQLPNDIFIFTCRIKRGGNKVFSISGEATRLEVNNSKYLKRLETDLKNYKGASSKEKVNLCVGQETEVVNKAILCLRSSVFAKMCKNNANELNKDTITLSDIEMPVLRAVISFLYSGITPDCTFGFVCKLYSVAVKYDFFDLHWTCIHLLLRKISTSMQDLSILFQVFNLSLSHNDELLKPAVMTLISANTETIASTSDWRKLMCDDPEVALKASGFMYF